MENQDPSKEELSGVPRIQRNVKEYDPSCPQCRRDIQLVRHVHTDSISCAMLSDPSSGGEIPPTVILVRHSNEPRTEELRHLQEIAEMIWPGRTWRQDNLSTSHFFLQAEE